MARRATKIVATLGPASSDPAVLEQMILAGVNVVRLNFSHGKAQDHIDRARLVRTVSQKAGREVAIMADLQGPKIRVGRFAEGKVHLEPGAAFTLPAAGKGINRALYFYIGHQIAIAGKTIGNYCAATVIATVDLDLVNTGPNEARVLVLQGKPIGEQVIQYGPFVMNTKEEIQQAFEDYHATQFGGWPWNRFDQVHARGEGRFARHADGTFEQGV